MDKERNKCHQCRTPTIATTKDYNFAVCVVASCPNYGLAQIGEEQMWKFNADLVLSDKKE